MSTSYTGVPTSVDSPSPAPNLSGNYGIVTLAADGDALSAASVAQAERFGPNWTAYLAERLRDMYFGTAADGNLTPAAAAILNLSSMNFYDTLAMGSNTVNTNGWPILCRTAFTCTSNTLVTGNASGSGYISGSTPGPHANPPTGVVQQTVSLAYGAFYAMGGNGGNGGATTSVQSAVANVAMAVNGAYRSHPYRIITGATGQGVGIGASPIGTPGIDTIRGGTAGSHGAGSSGSNGGAGGAGGGLVVIIAPTIVINGTFQSNGGNGATGGAVSGGGGGGGGGAFLFVCRSFTNNGATFTANNGTGAAGVGGGSAAGTAGAAGNTTPYIVLVP